jgi:Ras-related protein Rab-7A
MLVYDVTSQQSFDNLETWCQEFQIQVEVSSTFPFFVIGTHANSDDRVVSSNRAMSWCEEKGPNYMYWEVDNESGDGVDGLLQTMSDVLILGKYIPFKSTSVKSARSVIQ